MAAPVLFDLQGAQSVDHRDRGIARYVTELALALEEVAPERVRHYLLNPDLALPGGIEPLVASGKLRFVDELSAADYDGAVLHLASTIELAIGLDRLFGHAARASRCRVVATVFDLVQEELPDVYLEDPGVRRRYRSRLELLRQADRVVAISEYTRQSAMRILGLRAEVVDTVPLVASAAFRPPVSRQAAVRAAVGSVPGLRERFVLYTGGSDGRKNAEGLLEAWGAVRPDVRAKWQLVLACHLPPLRRNHLEVLADRLGFGEGFLATGFVPEDALVLLNQAADLLVMPSLHEGFGFPVAEALACGTPAIGSDRTSIPELLPADGLFDPTDVPAAAAAIERALTDGDYRRSLLAWAARPRRTWHDVARGTIESYDRLPPARPARTTARAARPGRPRVGFVTPLPPQPGGVADYSHRLLEELRDVLDVTALVDGPPHHRAEMLRAEAPDGIVARPLAALDRIEGLCDPFDAVVWSLGNSEFHTGALAGLLRRRRGIVLAHDVRLTNLHRFAAWQHPDAVPGGFAATLQRLYDGRLPAALGAGGSIADRDADTWGVLMAADVVGACDRFLATSDFAATLARLDARAADRSKVGVLPFSVGAVPLASPTPAERRPGPPLVASFGVVNARKLAGVVIDAFAAATGDQRQARLVFVGPASEADAAEVRRAAGEAGIGGRVELTGEVDEDGYRRWLDRAWVAVQLRAATNGESSGATGDCLTAGVPTIVTAIGPNRAIPADTAVGVPAGADASVVAGELRSLLTSTDRRAALSAGARRYAAAHSFRRAAEALAVEVAALLDR